VLHHGFDAGLSVGDTDALHDIRRMVPVYLIEQRQQFLPVGLVEAIIGIHPEDPVAGGPAQGFIAGSGKAIDPGEVVHLGAVLASDLASAIVGAGVHEHDLVKDAAQRFH
jgi:hypothetical protein